MPSDVLFDILTCDGSVYHVTSSLDQTVWDLKYKIASQELLDRSADTVKLIFGEAPLQDTQTLLDVGLKHGSQIMAFLVRPAAEVRKDLKIAFASLDAEAMQILKVEAAQSGVDEDELVDLVNAPVVWGVETPAYIAAREGALDVLRLLVDLRADINLITRGVAPVHGAALVGNIIGLAALKDMSANLVDVPSGRCTCGAVCWTCCTCGAGKWRTTPLHLAAANGHVDAVAFLKENGANIEAGGLTGCCAAELAYSNRHVSCVQILQPAWLDRHLLRGFKRPSFGGTIKNKVVAACQPMERIFSFSIGEDSADFASPQDLRERSYSRRMSARRHTVAVRARRKAKIGEYVSLKRTTIRPSRFAVSFESAEILEDFIDTGGDNSDSGDGRCSDWYCGCPVCPVCHNAAPLKAMQQYCRGADRC